MVHQVLSILPSDSLDIWISTTANRIRDETVRILNGQLESIDVQVAVEKQNPRSSPSRSLQEQELLQNGTSTDSSILSILFNVRFSVQALVDVLDTERYVGAAFDSAEDRQAFIEDLQSSGDPNFDDLTYVKLELEDSSMVTYPSESQVPPKEENNNDDNKIGIIIASVAAAAAGLSVMALLAYLWTRSQNGDRGSSSGGRQSSGQNERFGSNIFSVNTEGIQRMLDPTLRQQDDISTLGDPIPQGVNFGHFDASVDNTGIPTLPYDYQAATRPLFSVDETGSRGEYSQVSSNIIPADRGDFATLDETMNYKDVTAPVDT